MSMISFSTDEGATVKGAASASDSIFMSISMMTIGEPAGFSFESASFTSKLCEMLLSLSGLIFVAVLLGLIGDVVLTRKLDHALGVRKVRQMKGHIVLCGIGKVGIRVLHQLKEFQHPVVVIEQNPDNKFVRGLVASGQTVIVGDATQKAVLRKAGIMDAKSVVACADNDSTNLEIALDAKELRPDIRVVVRVFAPDFAEKLKTGFNIHGAFSAADLAAPSFAAASVHKHIVNSFNVDGCTIVTTRLPVDEYPVLLSSPLDELQGRYRFQVLSVLRADKKQADHFPGAGYRAEEGDVVTITCSFESLLELDKTAQIEV